jgi:hypothetical protein
MKTLAKLAFIALLGCLPLGSLAQKQVRNDQQLWLGVFNQTRFNRHWGIWFDGHFRLRDHFVGEPAQAIFRPGVTFYAQNDLRFTLGYAYVHHFPGEGHEGVAQPEHRLWQQAQWFSRWTGARLMQWIRLEQRFRRTIVDDETLGDGYDFSQRLRFNQALFVPITRKKFGPGGWQLLVNDEVMFQFGENIVYNLFDQNRFFLGLVYQLTDHSQIHGGYMNLFQQRSSGNVYNSIHAIRFFYFHNLDFRKNHG